MGRVALELGVITMNKHQRVLQFRKWLILAAIVSVACGLLSTTAQIVKSYLEGARPFQPTYFIDFYACGGVDPITGEPLLERDTSKNKRKEKKVRKESKEQQRVAKEKAFWDSLLQ